MEARSTSARFAELLARQFSEHELRLAVQRELPELAPDLPGIGSSPRELAYALVRLAERHGCLFEVAHAVLLPLLWRRARSSRVVLIGVWIACVGAAVATGVSMLSPKEKAVTHEAPPVLQVEVPKERPGSEPEGPRATPDPTPPPRRVEGRRKRAAPIAVAAPTPEAPLPAIAAPPANTFPEARSGAAQCRGGVCRLSTDSGRFSRREHFCIVPADGSGTERCMIRGRLIHPASTVSCDLSEIRTTPLDGAMRWESCDDDSL